MNEWVDKKWVRIGHYEIEIPSGAGMKRCGDNLQDYWDLRRWNLRVVYVWGEEGWQLTSKSAEAIQEAGRCKGRKALLDLDKRTELKSNDEITDLIKNGYGYWDPDDERWAIPKTIKKKREPRKTIPHSKVRNTKSSRKLKARAKRTV